MCVRCGKSENPCEKREKKGGCERCTAQKVRCSLLDGYSWDGEEESGEKESPRKKKTKVDDEFAGKVAEKVSEEVVDEVLERVMEKMDDVLEENKKLREVVAGIGENFGEMTLIMRSWWAQELEFGNEKEKELDEEEEVVEEASGEKSGEKVIEEPVAMAVDGDESSTLRE